MLAVRGTCQIYLYTQAVDMRKSVNGLSAYVVDEFDKSPQCGDLFVFWNRARNRLKILWWDKNGFVLYYKRIEQHKFKIPRQLSTTPLTVTHHQLDWLLAGLDFNLMHEFSELNYRDYY